jgi:hypothetical protein
MATSGDHAVHAVLLTFVDYSSGIVSWEWIGKRSRKNLVNSVTGLRRGTESGFQLCRDGPHRGLARFGLEDAAEGRPAERWFGSENR